MNEEILQKIDKIFENKGNSTDIADLKKSITFECKKLYNQMLQSGFSEYIAVAETSDHLDKINKIIENETDVNKIKNLLSEENKFKENIKNTTSETELSDNYDKESINNIIKIVEDAALENDNLQTMDIHEQNDEIIYKHEKTKTDENVAKTINKTTDTKHKWTKVEKKKYIKDILIFVGVLGITALVVGLLHHFSVLG